MMPCGIDWLHGEPFNMNISQWWYEISLSEMLPQHFIDGKVIGDILGAPYILTFPQLNRLQLKVTGSIFSDLMEKR